MSIIRNSDDVAQGAAFLAERVPEFASALQETGPLPLRLKPSGFAELLSAIVSQQVSTASAAAIWARVAAARLTEAHLIRVASDEDLKACGLSRPKIRYARALAEAGINFESLHDMPPQQVIDTLVAVPGIGSWTAEIYTMFSLGHADVFPAGDLALQESARVLFQLKERPKEKALREMALNWSPWQSVAARLLWAYYREIKGREGMR